MVSHALHLYRMVPASEHRQFGQAFILNLLVAYEADFTHSPELVNLKSSSEDLNDLNHMSVCRSLK